MWLERVKVQMRAIRLYTELSQPHHFGTKALSYLRCAAIDSDRWRMENIDSDRLRQVGYNCMMHRKNESCTVFCVNETVLKIKRLRTETAHDEVERLSWDIKIRRCRGRHQARGAKLERLVDLSPLDTVEWSKLSSFATRETVLNSDDAPRPRHTVAPRRSEVEEQYFDCAHGCTECTRKQGRNSTNFELRFGSYL
ncbi:hypothetical protein BDN72DRAFT_846512 [Pluteus cervinus]|uniref:Uncharacterized protein n=1 Tax=Pluteus cervinus TaxID=181527 RepID=A0ACD3AG50_9AGAR|nr:hypothetical protein BDN72DRAFT_846512 [Pluteus cervinus]